ncbi:hypothetical protein pb186bvf_001781 [Paramecium bursaria]
MPEGFEPSREIPMVQQTTALDHSAKAPYYLIIQYIIYWEKNVYFQSFLLLILQNTTPLFINKKYTQIRFHDVQSCLKTNGQARIFTSNHSKQFCYQIKSLRSWQYSKLQPPESQSGALPLCYKPKSKMLYYTIDIYQDNWKEEQKKKLNDA